MTAQAEAADALVERVGEILHAAHCTSCSTPLDDSSGTIGAVQAAVDDGVRDVIAGVLVDQTMLRGMSVGEGIAELELGPARQLVIAWVHAAREMLGEAPNYSETRIDFPAVSQEIGAAGEERYVFTVQRAGKVTPHGARQAAEAARDAQRTAVLELHQDNGVGQCTTCSNEDAGPAAEVRWPCPTALAVGVDAVADQ